MIRSKPCHVSVAPAVPFARLLSGMLLMVAITAAVKLAATEVTNSATVTAPADAIEMDGTDNSASDADTVLEAVSGLSGTVYMDATGNHVIDPDDRRLAGWIIEVYAGEQLAGRAVSAQDGSYTVTGLAGGIDYSIRFRHPETGVVYGEISGVRLETASTLLDQDLPIDPSGVVYDAVTRQPVEGAAAGLFDRFGNPIPQACLLDPSQFDQRTDTTGAYRFDIRPGANPACPVGESEYVIRIAPPPGYGFPSTILSPQDGPLDPSGTPPPYRVGTSVLPPIENDPVYFLSFRLEAGDPDVIFNHIPLDPFLSRDGLVVTKTSSRRSASTGDLVPYEITVRNRESFRRSNVDVVDVLPHGLTYVEGSARVNGTASEPQFMNGNRELVWPRQTIPANGTVTYELVLVVGAGVIEGQAVNTGLAENGSDGSEISNRGTATVAIVPSTVFDCAELIGQVFEDRNGNGHQDDGEPGIPSVRLATVNGLLVTTDEHGRYHIACAAVPDARIGSNFVLRLDEETLPQGWAMTTDNPRSIRLTRGKMSALNFGTSQADIANVHIMPGDFAADGGLQPEALRRIEAVAARHGAIGLVRATYAISDGEAEHTLAARLTAIRRTLQGIFVKGRDGARPTIQVDAIRLSPESEAGE